MEGTVLVILYWTDGVFDLQSCFPPSPPIPLFLNNLKFRILATAAAIACDPCDRYLSPGLGLVLGVYMVLVLKNATDRRVDAVCSRLVYSPIDEWDYVIEFAKSHN